MKIRPKLRNFHPDIAFGQAFQCGGTPMKVFFAAAVVAGATFAFANSSTAMPMAPQDGGSLVQTVKDPTCNAPSRGARCQWYGMPGVHSGPKWLRQSQPGHHSHHRKPVKKKKPVAHKHSTQKPASSSPAPSSTPAPNTAAPNTPSPTPAPNATPAPTPPTTTPTPQTPTPPPTTPPAQQQ
jgi:hypothetical protein